MSLLNLKTFEFLQLYLKIPSYCSPTKHNHTEWYSTLHKKEETEKSPQSRSFAGWLWGQWRGWYCKAPVPVGPLLLSEAPCLQYHTTPLSTRLDSLKLPQQPVGKICQLTTHITTVLASTDTTYQEEFTKYFLKYKDHNAHSFWPLNTQKIIFIYTLAGLYTFSLFLLSDDSSFSKHATFSLRFFTISAGLFWDFPKGNGMLFRWCAWFWMKQESFYLPTNKQICCDIMHEI